MANTADKALLPAGMCDVLPPEAEFEAETVERLMASFAARGYQRVKPPLLEFEDALLSGDGSAMAAETFRLMDPVSQRMMGLRADMTLQVARIASHRLGKNPRPLRLAYAGQVLRVKGSQLRPERQFGQVGAELIGSASPDADAEVIVMAAEALTDVGIRGLSIDLGLPTLVPAVCAGFDLDEEAVISLRAALDRKDAAGIGSLAEKLGKGASEILSAMLAASGLAEDTLEKLAGLDLPPAAAAEWTGLGQVVARVRACMPELKLTIDPVESRGFEYHTGVVFTVFALNVRGELGRGGRYRTGSDADAEPATGLTLFTDSLLRALPPAVEKRRLYLPAGTASKVGAGFRREGWKTVHGLDHDMDHDMEHDLDSGADATAEARRMKCSHVLADGKPVTLPSTQNSGKGS